MRGAAAAWISGRARPPDAADAAEVVVEAIPAANGSAALLERCERGLVDTGLGVDDVERGVDAREADRRLGVEALVEDRREHRRERRSQACRACRADRELEAVRVEDERRRHAALEVVARLRIAERDVGLAEEVVQLRVEAGQPDAGADAERVREHARATVRVDRDHVRRVLAALG